MELEGGCGGLGAESLMQRDRGGYGGGKSEGDCVVFCQELGLARVPRDFPSCIPFLLGYSVMVDLFIFLYRAYMLFLPVTWLTWVIAEILEALAIFVCLFTLVIQQAKHGIQVLARLNFTSSTAVFA